LVKQKSGGIDNKLKKRKNWQIHEVNSDESSRKKFQKFLQKDLKVPEKGSES
jgi:hypothetical protein